MPAQILLTSDKKRVAAAPGAKTEFTLTIQNLTALLDDVAVSVAGVDPAWVQVVPAHAQVFAQGEAAVRVIFQPPSDPARAACGVYPLTVTGRAQEQSGAQADLSVELEIQFGGDYRIELGAGVDAAGGHEATFPLRVVNSANAPLSLSCQAQDPGNVCWYKIDPFQLSVPPGGAAEAVLSVRARQSGVAIPPVVFSLNGQGEWAAAGQPAILASQHAVSGQWGGVAAPTTLTVALEPYQPAAGGTGFHVRVGNPGLAPEAANLEFASAGNQLSYKFEPSRLALGPQGQAAADLLVWAGAEVTTALDFWVTARPLSPRTRPGSARATFSPLQPKKRPAWLIPLIAAIVVLLLICAVALALYLMRTQ